MRTRLPVVLVMTCTVMGVCVVTGACWAGGNKSNALIVLGDERGDAVRDTFGRVRIQQTFAGGSRGSLLVPTIARSIYIFYQHTSIFINRGVDCSRNGFCKDGRCFCGFGFTGKNCETDVNATQARIWDLEQKLNQVENDKRLCERQLMINLQPNQINSTDEVLKHEEQGVPEKVFF